MFDLDNTLVYTSLRNGGAGFHPVYGMWTQIRPHARDLLRTVSVSARIAVWTAGTRQYADEVVSHLRTSLGLDVFEIVLCREDCIHMGGEVYVKDLDAVRHRAGTERVFLVDDNPIHTIVPRNRGAVVMVPPYRGEVDDRALWTSSPSWSPRFRSGICTAPSPFFDRVGGEKGCGERSAPASVSSTSAWTRASP